LNLYRRIIALRGTEKALREGKYIALNADDANVLAFARQLGGETIVVALNMSDSKQSVKFEMAKLHVASVKSTTLVAAGAKGSEDGFGVTLEPYGVYVAKIGSASSR
jgi:alpha-glucosidase